MSYFEFLTPYIPKNGKFLWVPFRSATQTLIKICLTLCLSIIINHSLHFCRIGFRLGHSNGRRVSHGGHGCGWHHQGRHVKLVLHYLDHDFKVFCKKNESRPSDSGKVTTATTHRKLESGVLFQSSLRICGRYCAHTPTFGGKVLSLAVILQHR